MDFCDFLNSPPVESDKGHVQKIFKDKSLHFVVDESRSECLGDSVFEKFIKNDEFIQNEIHNGYYRLNVTFYKKSKLTDALLKMRSSKYLDYCENDIVVEYQWLEGKPSKHPMHYKNGVIEEAEKIQLDSVK